MPTPIVFDSEIGHPFVGEQVAALKGTMREEAAE